MEASTSTPPNPMQVQSHPPNQQDPLPQLGTLRGVYLPCLQNILGVILFLRLTHITSQAGTLFTTLILLISTASTLFTWSSLSAIVTNGTIKSGGPYYIISRTLGADIGCSLGLLYYIGNTLSGSMFVLGVVEAIQHSVRAYYARWGYGFSGHVFPYDVQVTCVVIVISLTFCVHVGNKYVNLFSNIFLGVTATSIICMCLGCALFASGVFDGNLQPFDRSYAENVWPRYEPDPYTGDVPDIYTSLALLYPSVTGILSGMSKSGRLKKPHDSIPKGTFWAIMTSSGIYLLVCWLFGMSISNRTLKVDKFVTASVSYPHELIVRGGVIVSCFGLILGCLSSAPNLLAAMSSDEVLPFLTFLRPNHEHDAPIKALWFTSLLVAIPTLGGNLDRVSPFATIFYLLMYAGVNASTCISGYVRPPGFRPTFRFFHWSVSFVGFVWCLGLSFVISGLGTFCSLLAYILLHAYIKKSRRLAATGMKWGTLGSAVRYNIVSAALTGLAKTATSAAFAASSDSYSMSEEGVHLSNGRGVHSSSFSSHMNGSVESIGGDNVGDEENINDNDEWVHFHPNPDFHAKNWRPQLLTIVDVDFNGTPKNLHMLSLASQLQQTGQGINVVVSIIDRSAVSNAERVTASVNSICSSVGDAVNEHSEEVSVISGDSEHGDRWRNEEASVSTSSSGIDHIDTIKLIRRSKGLLMLHMKREGMDGFAEVSTTDGKFFEAVWSAVIHTGLGPLSPNTILLSFPSFLVFDKESTEHSLDQDNCSDIEKQNQLKAKEFLRIIQGILNLGKAVILFKGSHTYPKNGDILPERGTIDIWWIVHDGGLLLLLPFLLSKHVVWGSCVDNTKTKKKKKVIRRKAWQRNGGKLRLFAVTTNKMESGEKLQKAVEDHLEKVRIHAEVHIIDCLAGTNVASFMRDGDSIGVSPSHSAAYSIPSRRQKSKLSSRNPNRLVSLREDGISTQHMTLGEVFLPQECEVVNDTSAISIRSGAKDLSGKRLTVNTAQSIEHVVDSYTESEGLPSDTNEWSYAANALNSTIRMHSSGANLVVTNLPVVRNDQYSLDYFNFVSQICEGIDNVMLVRGSGAEVITAYA